MNIRHLKALKLKSCICYLTILISIVSCVQAQQRKRICRFNHSCLIFPNEVDDYKPQVPIWSPVPSFATVSNQRPEPIQLPIPSSDPQLQYPQPNLAPLNPLHRPSESINSYYNPQISKNVSLSVLNLAQVLSRHFQSTSLHGEQIFSPVSIFSVLQLLLTGANGKTYTELNRFLSYYSDMGSAAYQEEFGKLIEDLISDEINPIRQRPDAEWKFTMQENYVTTTPQNREPKLTEDRKHKVRVANGIFVQEGYNLRQAYEDVVKDIYKSEVTQLNFNQKNYVENYINNWVKERTYGKIPTIIDKGGIKKDTSLIMACALYFKAFWENPFIGGGTVVNDFYPDGMGNPSIKVNMMANGGVFPYYDDKYYQIKVIGFPYKEGKTTMYVFQPYDSTRERLRKMQEELTPEIIEFMISQMKKKTAVFAFPRLHVTNSFNMKTTLSHLGLHSIFSIDQSDLSLISNGNNFAQQNIYPVISTQPINYYIQPSSSPIRHSDIIFLNRIGNPDEADVINGSDTAMEKSNVTTTTPPSDLQKENNRQKRAVTYKTESDNKRKQQPLRFKDLVINKRITKLNKGKKNSRTRRDTLQTTQNQLLNYLQSLRNSPDLIRPNLFVEDIIHKLDLVVNEEGTEGAAATITYLRRSGTDVVFRAETPFLILIRHDTTKLPIFYGAIFEPTFN